MVLEFLEFGDDRKKALAQATATLRLEGIELDDEYSNMCKRVLYGDMSLNDLIDAVKFKNNVKCEWRKIDLWEAWLIVREQQKYRNTT